MKKGMGVLLLWLLAVYGAAILSACATFALPVGSETDSEEVKVFKRATLAMANQVADLLQYDYEYYDPKERAELAYIFESDPAVREELRKKYVELTFANPEINSLKHALATGKTLCGGYSKLFYKLAEEAGYDVYYILTSTHAYNAIRFEGAWYFFDVTGYDTGKRNVKWLWSTEIWNGWMHTSHVELYKLGTDYEIDRNATQIATEGIEAFTRSEGDFKVLIRSGTVTITGYTGTAADVHIPATIGGRPVVAVDTDAFSSGITSISIPASVTRIFVNRLLGRLFSGCTDLTAILVDTNNKHYTSRDGVLFDKRVTTLIKYPAGKEARQYAIPEGVTSIEKWAFSDCTGLTAISIPASVTFIWNGLAFADIPSLTAILVDKNHRKYKSLDGVLFNKRGNELIKYPAGKEERQYVIPRGVKKINLSAFAGCTGLTAVSIPSSVTKIEYGTFRGCTGLSSVSIPSSVTWINEAAFLDCTNLSSVSIPAKAAIWDSAFSGCTGITSIRIGANVRFFTNYNTGNKSTFANNFVGYYDTNGQKAGVYTFRNNAWSYAAQ